MLMSISMMDWSFWSSWLRLMSQCDGSHTSPGLLDAYATCTGLKGLYAKFTKLYKLRNKKKWNFHS